MATKKPKAFTIRNGGKRWTLTSATLYANDFTLPGSTYNHPTIAMEFSAPDPDFPNDPYRVTVGLSFQREPARDGDAVAGIMDTARRWGNCYGGRINLTERPFEEMAIGGDLPSHGQENRLRAAVGKRLRDAAEEFNLYAVNPCQCTQMISAIEKLGGYVVKTYSQGEGGRGYVSRTEARAAGVEFRANDKHSAA